MHQFSEQNLDDAIHELYNELINEGVNVIASSGENVELTGVMVEISNPRARLSRTETRGKPFSCLGELLWYLSGSQELEFIQYYISEYKNYAEEDGSIHGCYGPRIFSRENRSQFEIVQELLKKRPSTRQAVIQIFTSSDIVSRKKNTPCTCTLQFLNRDDKLNLIVYMRSNDAFIGFPHDVFAFTMIQEIMAVSLGLEIGFYKHIVGSMHIYTKHLERVKDFINEGFQSTLSPMPSMPMVDNMSEIIDILLQLEAMLRNGYSDISQSEQFISIPNYWKDIVRLLNAYRCSKDNDLNGLTKIKNHFSSDVYELFLDRKMKRIQMNTI